MTSFQKVMVKSRQPGSASLPDPVALETEEQTLERQLNERDVLSEALGEYKCDAGISVDNMPAVTVRLLT
jgi:hypothetical protein